MGSKYDDYSFDDFLDDPDFVRFVKYNGEDDRQIWNDWLAAAPANERVYHAAESALIAMLSVVPVVPLAPAGKEAKKLGWEEIEKRILRTDHRSNVAKRIRRTVVGVAASAAIVIAGYWYYNDQITIHTGYGEVRNLVLPDKSEVILNANTSLKYYRAWWLRGKRETWLDGEGYFKVMHLNKDSAKIKDAERFTVYTNRVVVQDLGTIFNIKQRRNEVTVALVSGKIRVTDLQQKRSPLILHPGEAVSFRDTAASVVATDKMTNQPQAWTERKIEANGMMVQDIIDNFRDTYGVDIILSDPKKATMRIDGTMSLATQEGTLYMLANILNADVKKEGNVIYLHLKK